MHQKKWVSELDRKGGSERSHPFFRVGKKGGRGNHKEIKRRKNAKLWGSTAMRMAAELFNH